MGELMFKKILFDWSSLIREYDLFLEISQNSNNKYWNVFQDENFHPDLWREIKSIGNHNYFSQIQNQFFKIAELENSALETVNHFYSNFPNLKTFISFDENPRINSKTLNLEFASSLKEKQLKFNGIYIYYDKISLARNIKFDYFFDDDPRSAITLASLGVRVFLLRRPWNNAFDLNDIKIFSPRKNLDEVINNIIFVNNFQDFNLKLTKELENEI